VTPGPLTSPSAKIGAGRIAPPPETPALQSPAYVLVTAARNESAFLPATIETVAAQTHRPARWVIVDDRSTDSTSEVIRGYLPSCGFIRLLTIPGDGATNFGKKAAAFNAGLELLRDIDYSYVGNLDADTTLPHSYYETLLREFERDPELGIAGGAVYSRNGTDFIPINAAADSVPGAIQLFRRSCFDDVGGRYLLLEKGGIDAAAEIMARMRGWEVRQYPDIRVHERRRTGTSSGGTLLAKYREGLRFHSLGYGTLFYLLRSAYKLRDRPFVLGSMAALAGFLSARLLRHPISMPPEVVLYLQAEQKQKLRLWILAHLGLVVTEADS
jgi:glycosyltransferase involved in cell wall biosynthesis